MKSVISGKHYTVEYVLLENAPRFSSSHHHHNHHHNRHHHQMMNIMSKQPSCSGLGNGWGMKPSLGRPQVISQKIFLKDLSQKISQKNISQKPQILTYHYKQGLTQMLKPKKSQKYLSQNNKIINTQHGLKLRLKKQHKKCIIRHMHTVVACDMAW